MTAEVMAFGVEPADRPEFACVAPHMFKTYDDEGAAYCTACHRVMAGAHAELARHYRQCVRPPAPAAAAARTYACGACEVTMDDGGQWTRHFGTRDHWLRYNAAMLRSAHFQPSHVHECEPCGVTFYRTEEYIRRHMFAVHDAGYRVDGWKRVMTAVYRARSSYYTGAMHCCSECGQVRAERQVHDPMRPACGSGGSGGYDGCGDGDDDGSSRPLETFFCDTCRLTFVGREDTYLLHVASPEHVALAENLPLWRAGRGADGGEADDAAQVDLRGWTVPAIVWRHFGGCPRAGPGHRRDEGDDDYDGGDGDGDGDGGPRACGLCGDLVSGADETSVLEHLDACDALLAAATEQLLPTPPSGKSAADYDAYRCGVCGGSRDDGDDDDDDYGTMADFRAWSRHVTAGRHLMTPHAMAAYAYSDCAGCRTLYFGPAERADDGSPCAAGGSHRFRPLPVADPMRFVYRETNAAADRQGPPPHFYYEQATGQYGRCERSADPGAVPFYCVTCRLEFYGNRAAFRQHALTAEHMLLRQYAPFELQAAAAAANRSVGSTAAAAAADDGSCIGAAAAADDDTVTVRTSGADTVTLLNGSYGWRVDAALDSIPDPRTRAVAQSAIGVVLRVARAQQQPPPPAPYTPTDHGRRSVSSSVLFDGHSESCTTRLFDGHSESVARRLNGHSESAKRLFNGHSESMARRLNGGRSLSTTHLARSDGPAEPYCNGL